MPIVVVGKQTAYMGKLKPLVRQLEGRIMFLTQVSNHELVHLYQMAELSIFMSLFEGFGLPVAEAQACGCPVLTSNRSSMPEAGGDGGFYVDPEDTEEIALGINVLLGDEATRNRHILRGRENAERFRPELYARELMKIYQNL
jgi:glycosyltransferase involved in cell wall biosynthesis